MTAHWSDLIFCLATWVAPAIAVALFSLRDLRHGRPSWLGRGAEGDRLEE